MYAIILTIRVVVGMACVLTATSVCTTWDTIAGNTVCGVILLAGALVIKQLK